MTTGNLHHSVRLAAISLRCEEGNLDRLVEEVLGVVVRHEVLAEAHQPQAAVDVDGAGVDAAADDAGDGDCNAVLLKRHLRWLQLVNGWILVQTELALLATAEGPHASSAGQGYCVLITTTDVDELE